MAEDSKRRKKTARITTPGVVREVMDVRELSDYLGIGKSKIYALIRAKGIPASKISRQYRFYKGLIDRWLQERVITEETKELPLFENKEQKS